MFNVRSREATAHLANVYFFTSLVFQIINAAAAKFIVFLFISSHKFYGAVHVKCYVKTGMFKDFSYNMYLWAEIRKCGSFLLL
jgi:hypothetical protein